MRHAPGIVPGVRRAELIHRLEADSDPFDIAIVGGGATGLGSALDAAARGYRVVLVERFDFGKGTSSRSTKLVHGGLRYLRAGEVKLVFGALRERGLLLENAADFVQPLPFVIPTFGFLEKMWYGLGVKVYSLLAGKRRIDSTRLLGKSEAMRMLPTLDTEGNNGGVLYWDAQFDDAGLIIALLGAALGRGALPINYCTATGLLKDETGRVNGLRTEDTLTGKEHRIHARVVVNATGAWSDTLRGADNPEARPVIAPSKGSHIVLPRKYLPGTAALLVPKTSDGRVIFAVPWLDRVVIGTTDIALKDQPDEMVVTEEEIEYILETAGRYIGKIDRADILSVFAGIRPLVKPDNGDRETSEVSRDHEIMVSETGLITVAGGKWTTYRHMAEETIDAAAKHAKLPRRSCRTSDLQLRETSDASGKRYSRKLTLTNLQVRRAAREECAMTLEDVLSRRSRCLLLDAREAIKIAPAVAADLASALGESKAWAKQQIEEFTQLAETYYIV